MIRREFLAALLFALGVYAGFFTLRFVALANEVMLDIERGQPREHEVPYEWCPMWREPRCVDEINLKV